MGLQSRIRGQITPFLIIGLLLILAGGILYYSGVLQTRLLREKITYPEGTQPVANFVTQCIADAGRKGVELLGQQGGYINLPPQIANEPKRYLAFDTLGLRKIPLWYTEGVARIPTIDFLARELNMYVKEDMLDCLDQFSAFSAQYTVEPQAEPTVTTTFTDEDVFIEVNYPINIIQKQNGLAYDIAAFNTPVLARVKAARDLAERITLSSMESTFLENLTLDLMAMDTQVPMDGLYFTCGEKTWQAATIKQRLQRTLEHNLINIRIKNTNHRPFIAPDSTYQQLKRAADDMVEEMIEADDTIDIEDTASFPTNSPEDAFEYANMYIDVGTEDEDMQAAFQYDPAFGMNLLASPNRNGILRSSDSRAPKMLNFLCIQQYHFLYDVQYPVRVSVRDPTAFNNEGYLFDFGLFVTIDDNEARPTRQTYDPWEDLISDEAFCHQIAKQTYEFRAIGYDSEGYRSDSGLSGANVTLACGGRLCNLGTTKASSGVYRLLTRLPSNCVNPFIKMQRDGYLPATTQLLTAEDKRVDLELTKLKRLRVDVVKHKYYADVGGAMHEAEALDNEENVTLSFSILGRDHDQFVFYPSSEAYVDVIDGDGTYEVNAMLTRRDTWIGGYRSNNLTITYDQIKGHDTIQLHVFEYQPIPLEETQQEDMMRYMIGESYTSTLTPTFT